MSPRPKAELKFDASVVSRLACPACYGNLRLDPVNDAEHLVCVACERAYPIVDGIPVLIVDRAEERPDRD